MTTKLRTLRNYDQADVLMRELTPFRSRVRLYDRHGDFGPWLALSGTVPCSLARRGFPQDRTTGSDCVSATAKQGDAAWGGACEGTIERFCHTLGSLPHQYHESLLAADFVVRSYATPIAWHVLAPDWNDQADVERWLADEHPGIWIIPEVSYSLTTYQHQSQVRWALAGSWRNKLDPIPHEYVKAEGAPHAVPSGTTGIGGVSRW